MDQDLAEGDKVVEEDEEDKKKKKKQRVAKKTTSTKKNAKAKGKDAQINSRARLSRGTVTT